MNPYSIYNQLHGVSRAWILARWLIDGGAVWWVLGIPPEGSDDCSIFGVWWGNTIHTHTESDLRGYEIIGYEIVRYQSYEYKNDEEYFENFRVTLLTDEGKTFSYNVYIAYSKGVDGNRLKESDITNVRVSYNN